MDKHSGSGTSRRNGKVKTVMTAGAITLAGLIGASTAGVAQAAYYDSRYSCHAVGSFGNWRAYGYDNRGNHDYTGPKRTFKVSATNDCLNWLSVG
jgi:hypothetical protein